MERGGVGGYEVISIEDLYQQRLPVTGTISLDHHSSNSSSYNQYESHSDRKKPKNDKGKRKSSDNCSDVVGGEADTLKPLNHPTILIGTIHMWNPNTENIDNNSIYTRNCPHFENGQCLAFTDHTLSGSICCAVLNLDPLVIGHTIHILSWNFIPSSKRGCPYPCLEVNRWRLATTNSALSHPSQKCGSGDSTSSTNVVGKLYAISPPFFLPCVMFDKMSTKIDKDHSTTQPNPFSAKRKHDTMAKCVKRRRILDDGRGEGNTGCVNTVLSGNSSNLKLERGSKEQTKLLSAEEENEDHRIGEVCKKNGAAEGSALGFLIELRACNHKPQCKMASHGHEKQHACVSSIFVYFAGTSSAWRSVLSALFGKCLSVTGLKRKVILVGKEKEQYNIFVTTKTSTLSLLSPNNPLNGALSSNLDDCNSTIKANVFISRSCAPETHGIVTGNLNEEGQGSTGSYIGVITGIHMHSSILELDKNVWLLLTHQPLTQVHGLRIGALLALRHVHFIKIEFAWEKILVLGACFRSHIVVKSFSPLRTMFNIRPSAWSLLSRYIESLPFTAGLWVLLTTICFRRKFQGFFCEKEILGSKNNKGMVQRYVHSMCSPFYSHRDVLKEFFKHDSCPMGRPTDTVLHLIVPIINFCRQIEAMWVDPCSIIWKHERHKEASSLEQCRKEEFHVIKHIDGHHFVRRIISGKMFGVVLIGNLQVSQQSGQLQLVDATGSVDVVVPDFVSRSSLQNFYEVADFNVVVEGFRGHSSSLEMKDDVLPISCARIMDGLVSKHKLPSLTYYVHFYLKNAISFNVPKNPVATSKNLNHIKMQQIQQGGIFSIVLVTHKYPITGKFVYASDQNAARSFAEAILLPCSIVTEDSKHSCYNEGHVKIQRSYKSDDIFGEDGNMDCRFETLNMVGTKPRVPCMCSNTRKVLDLDCASYANANGKSRECNIRDPISCDGHGHQNHLSEYFYNGRRVSENSSNKEFQSETRQKIQCSLFFRNLYKGDSVVQCVLFPPMNCQDVEKLSQEDLCSKKVLLEFNSESLYFYQVLHIGDCYLIQHEEVCSVYSATAPTCFKTNKIAVSSCKPIWSLSIASYCQIPQHCHQTPFCSSNDSHNTPSLTLKFYDINKSATFGDVENGMSSVGWHTPSVCVTDVCLYIPCEATDLLQKFIERVKGNTIPSTMDACDAFNEYFTHRMMPNSLEQFSKAADFESTINYEDSLVDGKFISLTGEVMDVRCTEMNPYASLNQFGCKYLSTSSNLKFPIKVRYTISVQGSHGMQKIRLSGVIGRSVFPLGFGPGVFASFYRILLQKDLLGIQGLLVTPASFIVVNSIKEVEYDCNGGNNTALRDLLPGPSGWRIKKSMLISFLSQSTTLECFKLHCRVVAIQSLVMEWKLAEYSSVCPHITPSTNILDSIQISGKFILDDGTGLCDCWASGARAACLLSIHSTSREIFENVAYVCNFSKRHKKKQHHNSVGLLLKKLVKKHRQVSIQKDSNMVSPQADFMILGISEVLNPDEHRLISFVIEKACISAPLVIIGTILDAPDQHSQGLEKCEEVELNTYQENFSTLTQFRMNILARDVFPMNYLQEAGYAFEELMSEI